jgi:phosphoketolase
MNTPFDMAILNNIDRFQLVCDVIDRVPQLGAKAGYVKQRCATNSSSIGGTSPSTGKTCRK